MVDYLFSYVFTMESVSLSKFIMRINTRVIVHARHKLDCQGVKQHHDAIFTRFFILSPGLSLHSLNECYWPVNSLCRFLWLQFSFLRKLVAFRLLYTVEPPLNLLPCHRIATTFLYVNTVESSTTVLWTSRLKPFPSSQYGQSGFSTLDKRLICYTLSNALKFS